ncbi:MAG: 50S ribosomal protein L31 [Clostridiales bacterium]|nr:50S ribosomal protein L31 [Clostridiales bacterium]
MKNGIHPNYHEVDVVCACGETFKSKSTVNGDTIRVEICNKCHPFYTGKRKMVDSSGRVDKFKKKFNME